jgi:hypothetical protein
VTAEQLDYRLRLIESIVGDRFGRIDAESVDPV